MQELTPLLQYRNIKCDPILKNVGVIREKSETSFEGICARVILNTYCTTAEYKIDQTTRKNIDILLASTVFKELVSGILFNL